MPSETKGFVATQLEFDIQESNSRRFIKSITLSMSTRSVCVREKEGKKDDSPSTVDSIPSGCDGIIIFADLYQIHMSS